MRAGEGGQERIIPELLALAGDRTGAARCNCRTRIQHYEAYQDGFTKQNGGYKAIIANGDLNSRR